MAGRGRGARTRAGGPRTPGGLAALPERLGWRDRVGWRRPRGAGGFERIRLGSTVAEADQIRLPPWSVAGPGDR